MPRSVSYGCPGDQVTLSNSLTFMFQLSSSLQLATCYFYLHLVPTLTCIWFLPKGAFWNLDQSSPPPCPMLLWLPAPGHQTTLSHCLTFMFQLSSPQLGPRSCWPATYFNHHSGCSLLWLTASCYFYLSMVHIPGHAGLLPTLTTTLAAAYLTSR